MSDDKQRQTVIDEGTGFTGDFDSACPIVVKGHIEGKMTAPSLTIDASGSVSGTVKVKEMRSEGEISGEFDADYVKLSGVVKDNTVIRARTLEVNLSPTDSRMEVTFGHCELAVGDVPEKAKAVAAAEEGKIVTDTIPPLEAPAAAGPSGDAPPGDALDASDGAKDDKGNKGGKKRRNTSPPPT